MRQSVVVQLDEVARDLYAEVPARFTAARDAAVNRVRAGGDRELAAAIKALRRPATGAWLVNLLARERSGDLSDLLELGSALREAQEALDGPRLRVLSRQRHDGVQALVRAAAELGGAHDDAPAVTQAVERDVSATLEAALADPDAGAAARSGLLVRALRSTGLDAVDLAGAVAVDGAAAIAPDPEPASGRPALRVVGDPGPTPERTRPDPSARRRERGEAARTAVVEARSTVRGSERELAAAIKDHAAARDHHDELRERIAELEDELQHARRDRRAAEQDVQQAEKRETVATRARDAARKALERAEAHADTVRSRRR